ELRQITTHRYSITLAQPLLRDRAGGDAHHRLARRRPAAAARVADPVFLPIGVVRVAGPELLGDRGVVFRARVFVAHDEADRGAGGTALVHPGEDLDRVGLAALRDVARRARLSPIQFLLNIAGRGRQGR